MNIFSLILSLLLILSFGSLSLLEKRSSGKRLMTSFSGHLRANRHILSQCEKEIYKSFEGTPTQKTSSSNPREQPLLKKKPKNLNRLCARINLRPLIEEGKEAHPFLYETTLLLFSSLYEIQEPQPLLDCLLAAAKQQNLLEKIELPTPSLQRTYYTLLKGEKQGKKIPLTDLFSIEKKQSKMCPLHTQKEVFQALFSPQGGLLIFDLLHQKQTKHFSQEEIKHALLSQRISTDLKRLDLFVWGRKKHPKMEKEALFGMDPISKISLRKHVSLYRE